MRGNLVEKVDDGGETSGMTKEKGNVRVGSVLSGEEEYGEEGLGTKSQFETYWT